MFIREHASPAIQQSANAFYYEKLVYLASMILRRDDAATYRVQINELGVGIRAGLQDPNLGRNPRGGMGNHQLPGAVAQSVPYHVKRPALTPFAQDKHHAYFIYTG